MYISLEDFDQEGVREMTKPLFSIPPHQFLFNAGSIDKKIIECQAVCGRESGTGLFESGIHQCGAGDAAAGRLKGKLTGDDRQIVPELFPETRKEFRHKGFVLFRPFKDIGFALMPEDGFQGTGLQRPVAV